MIQKEFSLITTQDGCNEVFDNLLTMESKWEESHTTPKPTYPLMSWKQTSILLPLQNSETYSGEEIKPHGSELPDRKQNKHWSTWLGKKISKERLSHDLLKVW